MTLAYSDPAANAGADPVATFDADDEIAFMADDTGGRGPGRCRVPGRRGRRHRASEVTVTDPLSTTTPVPGHAGSATCTCSSGRARPVPGSRASTTWTTTSPPPTRWAMPRTPRCRRDRYSTHFSARWTRDRLHLGAGPDILDRHRNLFAVGVCGRSEDTFSAGDGGYATNVDGPVRVIRSYLGANSGTYTQREHIFYRSTERVQTFLRVHDIPGIMDFYDYSPAAIGMHVPELVTAPAGVTDRRRARRDRGLPRRPGRQSPALQGALVSISTPRRPTSPAWRMQGYYTR